MRLFEILGCPPEELFSEKPKARWYQVLVRSSEDMLRARVTIAAADYQDFTALERKGIAEAGSNLRTELACQIGKAAQGPDDLAQVLAGIDGGDALIGMALDDLADELGGDKQ